MSRRALALERLPGCRNRRFDIRFCMRRAHERRFELRGRQVDSAIQHAAKEVSENFGDDRPAERDDNNPELLLLDDVLLGIADDP